MMLLEVVADNPFMAAGDMVGNLFVLFLVVFVLYKIYKHFTVKEVKS